LTDAISAPGVDVLITIFRDLLPIFGGKNRRFSQKEQCYDRIFAKTRTKMSKNANIFA
jgi:hypothetical protein